MTIRPFRLGDLLLLQRLRRHATQLNIERALLRPRSPFWTALDTLLFRHKQSHFTYVLRQHANGLAQAGIIQLQRRPGRPEADVTLLAPSLDAPNGHPAIWQKLLVQSTQDLVQHNVTRIFADLPEQPLLIDTFNRAGFTLYTRETIWRLSSAGACAGVEPPPSALVFPQQATDEWDLLRLYAKVTPRPVQQAEGYLAEETSQSALLEWPWPGQVRAFVLVVKGTIAGRVQVVRGSYGCWLCLWGDAQQDPAENLALLLRQGLYEFNHLASGQPLYIGVRDYHGGLSTLLADYGFVPFTDRARMVRHILQWAKEPALQRMPALEAVRDAVPTSLAMPKAGGNGAMPVCAEEK